MSCQSNSIVDAVIVALFLIFLGFMLWVIMRANS
jgi:hypothetical protein